MGSLQEVSFVSHKPFIASHIECHPSRIWHSLKYLKDRVTMLMSKPRQQQLCCSLVSLYFSLETG